MILQLLRTIDDMGAYFADNQNLTTVPKTTMEKDYGNTSFVRARACECGALRASIRCPSINPYINALAPRSLVSLMSWIAPLRWTTDRWRSLSPSQTALGRPLRRRCVGCGWGRVCTAGMRLCGASVVCHMFSFVVRLVATLRAQVPVAATNKDIYKDARGATYPGGAICLTAGCINATVDGYFSSNGECVTAMALRCSDGVCFHRRRGPPSDRWAVMGDPYTRARYAV